MNKKKLFEVLKNKQLNYVTVCFVDPLGQIRGKLVSIDQVIKSIDKNGSGFTVALPSLALGYGDTQIEISGFSSRKDSFGDIPAKIDLDSFRIIPWVDKTQNLICFLELENDYSKFCSRSILKKVLYEVNQLSFFPRFGVEIEFTLLEENSKSIRDKKFLNLKTSTFESSYNLLHRQHEQNDFYHELCEFSKIMNISVEAWHEEMGAGFMEVALLSGKGVKSADDAILVKHLIKQSALRFGKIATFMARWNNNADGQSGHIHISLENKKKENIFIKNTKYFEQFILGLQRYSPELMLLFAPNNNSYKRFQPDIFSPTKNDWEWNNRKVAFRAIKGSNKRIENRIPGADMNPYLSIAATIISGMKGIIENKKFKEKQKITNLPLNISESYKHLKNSKLAKKTFSNDFVNFFSEFRRQESLIEHALITDIEKKHLLEFS